MTRRFRWIVLLGMVALATTAARAAERQDGRARDDQRGPGEIADGQRGDRGGRHGGRGDGDHGGPVSRAVPFFDPAIAGIASVAVTGGAILVARRRRRT